MLEIRQLTRRFGEKTAVDAVDFDVPAGLMSGFVGANGAGKTTTMRTVMGVLGATSGEIRWQGRPITAADRRRFGYMPEERGLYPKQPILDQLVHLAELRGMDRRTARTGVRELLERFGLGERTKDALEKLSLGNQQRVQIIAALLPRPVALILDEPFSGLDPTAVDSMVELLRDCTREGVPVLFSSHQLDLVERLCDRVVVLRDGRVVASGTADELRAAGPSRHRIVLGDDAGWVSGVPGLRVVESEGAGAVVELLTPGAEQDLLAEAVRRGAVHEFAPVRPALSDIYREVTA